MEENMEPNQAVRVADPAAQSPERRERGTGGIFKPKYRDRKTGEKRAARFYWIKYRVNGRSIQENTHSDKKSVANQLVRRRLGEVDAGRWTGPKVQKTTIPEIMSDLFRNYRINGKKSLTLAEQRWRRHLEPFFGKMRAIEVTTDALARYIDRRQSEDAENGTINRELALLRRAFYLAFRSNPRKVYEVPTFTKLEENAARKGFVTYEQYDKLCRNCREPWLRALIAADYSFGFRAGELKGLRVRQVDLLARTITLDPGTTKNGKAREIKMTDEVYMLLCVCVLGKQPEDHVFTRENGKPIRDFRWAWWRLCIRAGLGQLSCPRCSKLAENESVRRCRDCGVALKYSGTIFHDFRRSAIRNMTRSGISRSVAMRISGHETESVFERYNIGDDEDLAEAARRIEGRRKEALDLLQTYTKESQSQPILAN
jgi:integrase